MHRHPAAVSRISFEQPDDWERAAAAGSRRKSFGEFALSRHGSGLSQTSEDPEEWDTWREEHPCALQHFEQIAREAQGKLVAVFLDYDGTLTPIVSNPDAAFMPEQAREAVRRVAEVFPTAIVSGRGREKVEGFVQLRQLFYAGSHGMDIVGPRQGGSCGASSSASVSRTQSGNCGINSWAAQSQAVPVNAAIGAFAASSAASTAPVNAAVQAFDAASPPSAAPVNAAVGSFAAASTPAAGAEVQQQEQQQRAGTDPIPAEAEGGEDEAHERFVFQPAAQYEPLMNAVFAELEAGVAPYAGSSVEHNKFCVSVHFRNCSAEDYPSVVAATEAVAAAHPQLHITRGRKVLEVRPQVDWDKGAALAHLLEAMGLDDPQRVHALYIGDDRTDEDAFRVLSNRGLGSGILVSTRVKPTAGRWTLRDPAEVAAFLSRLVAWGLTDANQWHTVRKCVGWRISAARQERAVSTGGTRAATLQQQQQQFLAATFAAMDGLAMQQQPTSSEGGSPGVLSSAASFERPPLPPKSRRNYSPAHMDLLQQQPEEPQQPQQHQQQQANGSVVIASAGSS